MWTGKRLTSGWMGLILLGGVGGFFTDRAYGHNAHGGSPTRSENRFGSVVPEKPSKPRPPEPYKGQKLCPVSGDRLGVGGPAVPVETVEASSSKPGFIGKLFGKKPSKVVIYVCCQGCAESVRKDPWRYLTKVMEDRRNEERSAFSAGAASR